MNMKYFLSLICLASALLGMAMLLFPNKMVETNKEVKTGYLATNIPAEIGSTVSKDIPLAQTEEVLRATENLLALSDFLNREYTLPDGRTFTVYVAYWEPNKTTIINASSHTPDRCWVSNGWESSKEHRINGKEIEIDGKKLMPAYSREYSIKANATKTFKRKVWFWFVTDGMAYDYKTEDNRFPNPFIWLKNTISESLMGYPEMYFIRVDSQYDLDELLKNKDFKAIMDKLGQLILYKPTSEAK